MAGFSFKACSTASGATRSTPAETRPTNLPIWGMPLAVFDGPRTGTPAASARVSAANACCDSVGPTMPSTPALITAWKALMAPISSPPVSWKRSLTGRPFTPPSALRSRSAIRAPMTSSWPSSATLEVSATAMPSSTASPDTCCPAPALAAGCPDDLAARPPWARDDTAQPPRESAQTSASTGRRVRAMAGSERYQRLVRQLLDEEVQEEEPEEHDVGHQPGVGPFRWTGRLRQTPVQVDEDEREDDGAEVRHVGR